MANKTTRAARRDVDNKNVPHTFNRLHEALNKLNEQERGFEFVSGHPFDDIMDDEDRAAIQERTAQLCAADDALKAEREADGENASSVGSAEKGDGVAGSVD